MWLPPSTWIPAAVSGAGHLNQLRSIVEGRTTKVVKCEKCEQRYAYELKRCAPTKECLPHVLANGIEAIPCPACGWYQSNMLSRARELHRRWMANVGICLIVGIIPAGFIGLMINTENGKYPVVESVANGTAPPIPWPIFGAGLACMLAAGIGMFIWRRLLAQMSNPNDDDVEARKRYGQSRAILLSEQEANDVLAHGRLLDRGAISVSGAVPDESVQQSPQGGVSSLAGTEPVSTVGNGPRGSEPQAGEAVAGCVGLLLLIGIGVIGWNMWQESRQNDIDEEMMRHDAAVRGIQEEQSRRSIEEWSKKRQQEMDQWRKIFDANNFPRN
jgi:hypothetical protein